MKELCIRGEYLRLFSSAETGTRKRLMFSLFSQRPKKKRTNEETMEKKTSSSAPKRLRLTECRFGNCFSMRKNVFGGLTRKKTTENLAV